MPIFMLSPVSENLWHADWTGSDHHLECVVIADDEDHARRLAADRFRTPLLPAHLSDPWTQKDLVTARELDREKDKVPGFPLGTVVPFMSLKAY